MSPAERDAMKDFIVRTIDGAVSKAVAAIDLSALRGKDGEKGEPGDRGDIGPQGQPGLDGFAGEKGVDGKDGRDGVDGKDAVLDMDTLALEVASLVPLPKDGRDGIDGKDAEPVDRVTLATDVLKLIPVPRDGKDGIASMDDLRSEVSKAVEALVAPTVEKQVTESIAALPTLQYRGVFREGTTYAAGECVTWAGATWHADSETKDKPGGGETAWTLMVKRGDKGKDAVLDLDALAKQVAAIMPKGPT